MSLHPDFNLVKFKRNVFQFSLVYHLFVGAPVIEISVSHWVGHFLAAIPNAFLSHPVKLISQKH